MSGFLRTTVALACALVFGAVAEAAIWPFSGKSRTPEQSEDYQFALYQKRAQEMKEYRQKEAEQTAMVVAAATAAPTPVPQIDTAKLVVPQLRPLLEDAAMHPRDLLPRERLAHQYMQLRRYDLALQELDEGFATQPDWMTGRMTRARVLWLKGDLDGARREYNLLVVSEPDWIAPRFFRAYLLEIMARNEGALEDWEMITQMAQQRGLVEMNAVAEQHIQSLRGQ